MHTLQRLALSLHAHAREQLYLRREQSLAAPAAQTRALSILVSRHEAWEAPIRLGFRGLPHRLAFDDIESAEVERFDLIVPLTLDDARFLRRQPAHVRERTLPLPDETCAALCHDKPRLNQHLIDAGFAAHIPPMGPGVAPPYLCKPARGLNSSNCILVTDGATETRLASQLSQPGTFRQAAVPGAIEYATHFLVRHGAIVRELTVACHHDRALFIDDGSAGEVVRTLGECPDLPTLRSMLRTIGYEGLGCARYKMDRGRLQLIDVDPRMNGGLGRYLFSFLRSLPQVQRTRESGCTNWTWLDSLVERDSSVLRA